MPKSIVAIYKIVTPMFLGGAQQEAGRIRGTALKGALAFWWRAFHFAGFVGRAEGDVPRALEAMRAREKELFGSSDGGQGRFLLRISHGKLSTTAKGIPLQGADMGARYLGYGLMAAFGQNAGQLSRSCINAGQSFAVRIIFRPNATDDDMAQITTALKLFGLLGGLGSRVRRGWGSVALERLEGAAEWQGPQSRAEYVEALKALFEGHAGADLPGANWPLTAFARESGVWITATAKPRSLDMLDALGRAFLNYRGMGSGQETAVGGQVIRKQFHEDHDWFTKAANDVDIPYRSAFGLPHMYNSKGGEGVETRSAYLRRVQGVNNNGPDRRASPMMFHIHSAGSENFAVVTLLPTRFLDEDEKVHAGRKKGKDTERIYDLFTPYGKREASGLDVLLDFLAAGGGKFKPNEVLTFDKIEQVLP